MTERAIPTPEPSSPHLFSKALNLYVGSWGEQFVLYGTVFVLSVCSALVGDIYFKLQQETVALVLVSTASSLMLLAPLCLVAIRRPSQSENYNTRYPITSLIMKFGPFSTADTKRLKVVSTVTREEVEAILARKEYELAKESYVCEVQSAYKARDMKPYADGLDYRALVESTLIVLGYLKELEETNLKTEDKRLLQTIVHHQLQLVCQMCGILSPTDEAPMEKMRQSREQADQERPA